MPSRRDSTQHSASPDVQRNLVYSGVTLGKRLVVLIGQRKALAIAVKGNRARRRWSKLRERLIGGDRTKHQAGRERLTFTAMVMPVRWARRSTAWRRVFDSTFSWSPMAHGQSGRPARR